MSHPGRLSPGPLSCTRPGGKTYAMVLPADRARDDDPDPSELFRAGCMRSTLGQALGSGLSVMQGVFPECDQKNR